MWNFKEIAPRCCVEPYTRINGEVVNLQAVFIRVKQISFSKRRLRQQIGEILSNEIDQGKLVGGVPKVSQQIEFKPIVESVVFKSLLSIPTDIPGKVTGFLNVTGHRMTIMSLRTL